MNGVGDQAIQALRVVDRFEKREAFLSPLSGKDDYFHHFAESFVVLLITRREYLRLSARSCSVEEDCAGLQCDLGAAGDDGVPHIRMVELLLRMLEKKEGR